MKIVCTKCRHENMLGRIFCDACGARLDLTRTSVAEVTERTPRDVARGVLRVFFVLVVLAVAGAVFMALRPVSPPAPAGDPAGARRTHAKLQGVQTGLASGQAISAQFTQKEINDYMFVASTNAGLRSMVFRLGAGRVDGLAVQALGPWKVAGRVYGPLDLAWTVGGTFSGNRFVVEQARLGQLPLPWIFKELALQRFARVYDFVRRQRPCLEQVKDVKLGEQGVGVLFQN